MKAKNTIYSFKSYEQMVSEQKKEQEKEDELAKKEKELRRKERALRRWEKDLEQREMNIREIVQQEFNELLLYDVLSGLLDDDE